MTAREEDRIRDRLVTALLDRIAADRYPSGAMMDLVEELLEAPEDLEAYAGTLLDKTESDAYPSLDLLARVRRLT